MVVAIRAVAGAMAQDWRTPGGGEIMPLKGVTDERIKGEEFP